MSGALMRIKKEEESRNSAAGDFSRTAGHVNHTGIPTQLKERVEQSTGMSLNDVRVHYNSILPAKLDALAYTKGNQVEISPGQERHLPHELGHVIQQKLGVVRANAVHSGGTLMNVDETLERQADEIGAGKRIALAQGIGEVTVQRCGFKNLMQDSHENSGLVGFQSLMESSEEEEEEVEVDEEVETKKEEECGSEKSQPNNGKKDSKPVIATVWEEEEKREQEKEQSKQNLFNMAIDLRARFKTETLGEDDSSGCVATAFFYPNNNSPKQVYVACSKVHNPENAGKLFNLENWDYKFSRYRTLKERKLTSYITNLTSSNPNHKINPDRTVDAEGKILEDIIEKNENDLEQVGGRLYLYSELEICPSCHGLFEELVRKYKKISAFTFYPKNSKNPDSKDLIEEYFGNLLYR